MTDEMNRAGKPPPEDAELDRLGIERVLNPSYTWGGYRYSNARDAIAAAKRGQPS